MAKPKKLSDLRGYAELYPPRVSIDELVGKPIVVHSAMETLINSAKYGENQCVLMIITVGEDDTKYEFLSSAWRILKFVREAIKQDFFPFEAVVNYEDKSYFLAEDSGLPF